MLKRARSDSCRLRKRAVEAARAEEESRVQHVSAGHALTAQRGLLILEIVVYQPAQHAGSIKIQDLIDEHLRRGEHARAEGLASALGRDQLRGALRAQSCECIAVRGVLLMAQQQRIHERIPQLADAYLDRAAIAHQRARVQADGVVHRADRQVRGTEEVVVVARMFDQPVEALGFRSMQCPA